jgi:PD-(D/E)XK nuclease superfamily
MNSEAMPTDDELRAEHCWQGDDRVGRSPEMTRFRRLTRYQQALWRESQGYPIGSQPHRPRPGSPSRPVGSRIMLDYAKETGVNLITPASLDAARTRTGFVERHQSFDHQRLWADLLSSEALVFNLFADIALDPVAATSLASAWFPELPAPVTEIRFAHSPGRLDPAYLNSLRAFDAALVLDAGRGRRGVIAVDVKFHELMKKEMPKPENRDRNLEVAQRSGVFRDGVAEELMGRSTMCETWLEHLLMLSMLQHEDHGWAWARHVVIHPAGNTSVIQMLEDYRQRLTDPDQITTMTLQHYLVDAPLPNAVREDLVARYTPAG